MPIIAHRRRDDAENDDESRSRCSIAPTSTHARPWGGARRDRIRSRRHARASALARGEQLARFLRALAASKEQKLRAVEAAG
jgi:hypothetical protein